MPSKYKTEKKENRNRKELNEDWNEKKLEIRKEKSKKSQKAMRAQMLDQQLRKWTNKITRN